jgi:hypothetical protein
MKSGGVLDQQVLLAALGKCQPLQHMWGLSGPAVLGIALALHVSSMEDVLALLRQMSSAGRIVGWWWWQFRLRVALQVNCPNCACGLADLVGRQESSWSSGATVQADP